MGQWRCRAEVTDSIIAERRVALIMVLEPTRCYDNDTQRLLKRCLCLN